MPHLVECDDYVPKRGLQLGDVFHRGLKLLTLKLTPDCYGPM